MINAFHSFFGSPWYAVAVATLVAGITARITVIFYRSRRREDWKVDRYEAEPVIRENPPDPSCTGV